MRNLQVTEKDIKFAHEMCKAAKVFLVFDGGETSDTLGVYSIREKTIFLNEALLKSRRSQFLSIFCHELGHHEACRRKIWRIYHSKKNYLQLNKQELQTYLRTALRAERWVDDFAEKMMKAAFPTLKCKKWYHEEYGKTFLRQWNKPYRKQLKRLNYAKRTTPFRH